MHCLNMIPYAYIVCNLIKLKEELVVLNIIYYYPALMSTQMNVEFEFTPQVQAWVS